VILAILEILKLAFEIWAARKTSPDLPSELREGLHDMRKATTLEERQRAVTRITDRINKL
jgi:predicted transcriptional regulator